MPTSRNEFCAVFDINYLPRGLVLYHSLAASCGGDVRLRVFCMDAAAKELLDRLALPGLVAIGLDELEAHDPELKAVKPTRTATEYCWTATPAVCLYALEREPELEQITYLDADMMFFADPAPLFDELGDDSVLLVPHRYAPEWQHWETTSGKFNVEFMTFRRSDDGLRALRWWHERCIEWCYFRFEDGKMGDQLYLDDWPERFPGVHVLRHLGGGLAPWNVTRFDLSRAGDAVLVDGDRLVFFHYQSFRLYRPSLLARAAARLSSAYRRTRGADRFVWTTNFPASDEELALIWEPYARALDAAYAKIAAAGAGAPGIGSLAVSDVVAQTARASLPSPVRSAVSRARRGYDRRRGRAAAAGTQEG